MTEIEFSSEIPVTLIRAAASDLDVVRSARVSVSGMESVNETEVGEHRGLIRYLMKNRHGSPYEANQFTFLVQAPVFVWREIMRHRIASYNEESARYKVLDPKFYIPSRNRNLVQVGKAGAYSFEPGSEDQFISVRNALKFNSEEAYYRYLHLMEIGVAREVARMVLPVNIFSSGYVTMNARALMNFLSLRTKSEKSTYPSFPQREIELVAQSFEVFFQSSMPLTHQAFDDMGRVAP